jgi:hypothetical protein
VRVENIIDRQYADCSSLLGFNEHGTDGASLCV